MLTFICARKNRRVFFQNESYVYTQQIIHVQRTYKCTIITYFEEMFDIVHYAQIY